MGVDGLARHTQVRRQLLAGGAAPLFYAPEDAVSSLHGTTVSDCLFIVKYS